MKEHGVDAAVREGEKSQFDVVRDGTTIFSKQREQRWPDEGEVLALLSDR